MSRKIVTYSRNVFVPLTTACRNHCRYCGFRSDVPNILSREEVRKLLKLGKMSGCKEALFTFGERPEISPLVRERLEGWGYSNVIEYLHDLCLDAIQIRLLPHSNPGVINGKELKLLEDVNASMGLMLESSSERLCGTGMPHEKSPGKQPGVRLRVLEEAGKLAIPFTTGILVGIGETEMEVEASLESIKRVQDRYGNIQEIIIQNFRPKRGTPMQGFPEPPLARLIHALKVAKKMFPEIGLQVPPNLNSGRVGVFLQHGANDFGGVSPATPDYVNPEDPWPGIDLLRRAAQSYCFTLRERLPVYPDFLGLVPERLKTIVDSYVDEQGLVKL